MTYTSCTVVIKEPIALCDNGFVHNHNLFYLVAVSTCDHETI